MYEGLILNIGGGRKFYLGGQSIIIRARSAREIFDHAHLFEVQRVLVALEGATAVWS